MLLRWADMLPQPACAINFRGKSIAAFHEEDSESRGPHFVRQSHVDVHQPTSG